MRAEMGTAATTLTRWMTPAQQGHSWPVKTVILGGNLEIPAAPPRLHICNRSALCSIPCCKTFRMVWYKFSNSFVKEPVLSWMPLKQTLVRINVSTPTTSLGRGGALDPTFAPAQRRFQHFPFKFLSQRLAPDSAVLDRCIPRSGKPSDSQIAANRGSITDRRYPGL